MNKDVCVVYYSVVVSNVLLKCVDFRFAFPNHSCTGTGKISQVFEKAGNVRRRNNPTAGMSRGTCLYLCDGIN